MIDLSWLQVVLAILGAVGGGGGIWAMIKLIMDRPHSRAQVEKIKADAAQTAVDTMQDVMDELRGQNGRLKRRLDELEGREAVIVAWAWRVWATLTADQRAQVGPPPITRNIDPEDG